MTKNMNLYYIDCNLVWELEPKEDNQMDENFLSPKKPSKMSGIYSFHIAAEYPDQLMPLVRKTICKDYPLFIENDSSIWTRRVEIALGLGGRKYKPRLEEWEGHKATMSEDSRLLFLAKNDIMVQTPNENPCCKIYDFHIASQYPDLATYVAFSNLKMQFPNLVRRESNTRVREISLVEGIDNKRYNVSLDEIK